MSTGLILGLGYFIKDSLVGDVDNGKAVLRDYIDATIGFEELSLVFDKSSKSLHAHVRAKRELPGEQPVCGDPLSAGAGGGTPGSQSLKVA